MLTHRQSRNRLGLQFRYNFGDRLNAGDHADGLAGHDGAGVDIAVDDGAAQGAGPEMFDFELGGGFVEFAALELFEGFGLVF